MQDSIWVFVTKPRPVGEAAGLTRRNVDVLRSRVRITNTAVEVGDHVTLGRAPKTRRSRRTVPVARSVMRQLQAHLAAFVAGTGRAGVCGPARWPAKAVAVSPAGVAAGG